MKQGKIKVDLRMYASFAWRIAHDHATARKLPHPVSLTVSSKDINAVVLPHYTAAWDLIGA